MFLNFIDNLMKMLQIQDQQTPQRAHDRKYKLECRFLIRKKCEQAECGISFFLSFPFISLRLLNEVTLVYKLCKFHVGNIFIVL